MNERPTTHEQGAHSDIATGTLYLCGTPIGNLEDITLRVLRILQHVDVIAAEDTRHTRKLLTAYDLQTPLLSLHEHNEQSRIPHIVQRLQEGQDVAVVSDAGMPGISDPGSALVQACVAAGLTVVPVPGPTALVTGLVASGLCTEGFVFEGFLPREAKRRRERLKALAAYPQTLIFYEAPHRLRRSLQDMLDAWGDRPATLARELTKLHEEFVRGTISELVAWCAASEIRGEFVVMVAGAELPPDEVGADEEEVRQRLMDLMRDGVSRRDAVRQVAVEANVPRRVVYDVALRLKEE